MNSRQLFKQCEQYDRLSQMLPPPAEDMQEVPKIPAGKVPFEAALWAPLESEEDSPRTPRAITEVPRTLESEEEFGEPLTIRNQPVEEQLYPSSGEQPITERTYSTIPAPYSVSDYVEIPKAPKVPSDFAVTELPPSRELNVTLDENGSFKFHNNKHLFHGTKLRVPKQDLLNAIHKAKEEFNQK